LAAKILELGDRIASLTLAPSGGGAFETLANLADQLSAAAEDEETFEGRDLATGELKWTGSRVDLVFGSNSELRALAGKEGLLGADVHGVG